MATNMNVVVVQQQQQPQNQPVVVQPQIQPVVVQPQVQPVVMVRSDLWSTGLCDCFDDMSACCCAFWCFPCFACMTTGDFDEFCGLPCFDLFSCVPLAALSLRYGVRKKYGIQVAREIKRRKTTFVMISPQPTVIQSPVMLARAM
ncbi:placenta-specific gene 8 protein-like isoform X2 [Alosa sapidissima]|uniref:placenta-specific gene 8 protein-like isoform X2 n=1 Tax=Alosa sapidissima TaxID=34773 RepID=UPI001C0A1280|nr:placenta-specific gene 8 protein-like isoform X2 [Alosa sapidissima]